MKYNLLFLSLSICFTISYAQTKKTTTGPVFKDYGAVYTVKDADLLLDTDKNYKVIFDVYSDEKKAGTMNPLVNTVARFINMHAQNGVPQENMDVILVLHGAATKNALNEKSFKKKYKTKHPNADLIQALSENDVKVYVCGQSLLYKGYDAKDVSEYVQVSLSALTALVKYQSEGYQIINFN